jgi:hypothetical protein
LEEHELNQERLAVGAEDSDSIPFTIRASNPQNRHMRHQKTDLLPPFQNIRCFSFVKQIYLDTFYCVYWKEYMGGRREVHLRPEGEETSVDGGAVEGKILDTTKRTKREERSRVGSA